MAKQFFIFATMVAISSASLLPGETISPAVPVIAKTVVSEPYDPNPQYTYGYDVQDPLTGDSHGQVETRNGDVVRGSYNLLEADGTRRVVDYVADPINGFNAVVSKQAPVVVKAAPVVPAPVLRSPVVPVLRSRVVPAPVLPSPLVPGPLVKSAVLPAPLAPLLRSGPWAAPAVVRAAPSAGWW